MPFVSLEFILLGVRRIDSIAPKERMVRVVTLIIALVTKSHDPPSREWGYNGL